MKEVIEKSTSNAASKFKKTDEFEMWVDPSLQFYAIQCLFDCRKVKMQ